MNTIENFTVNILSISLTYMPILVNSCGACKFDGTLATLPHIDNYTSSYTYAKRNKIIK